MRKKSKGLLVCAVLGAGVVLLAGCASTYHYSNEAQPEQEAVLKIVESELTVVALDEVGVKWKGKTFGGSTVYLPAGPHTLTVNYKKGSSLLAFYGKGEVTTAPALHVSGNFLPGHTYLLNSGSYGNMVNPSITDQGLTGGQQ
jgi:hypothetical protein